MNCDRPDIAEKLVPYVEGALGEPDRTEVANHLRRCLPCQDEAKQVKESILTLKAAVRTGIWKEPREHTAPDLLALFFEDERAREAGFLPSSGLSEEFAREVRVHLAECSECREELALLRELEAEPLGEPEMSTQPLPRALRLEIERLYPSKSATPRSAGERTVGLADRLMAWINPKSLVMASLCVVALTFSYSLTHNPGQEPPVAARPGSSTTEIAMADDRKKEAPTEGAASKKTPLQEVSDKLGKGKTQGLESVSRKSGNNEKAADKPALQQQEKQAENRPAAEPARRESDVAAKVRSTPTPSAVTERPKPTPAHRPAPVTRPPAVKPHTVVSSTRPETPRQQQPRPAQVAQAPSPADTGLLAARNQADEEKARDDKDNKSTGGVVSAEPSVVASAPTGEVANAMTAPDSQVAVNPNPAPAPVSAGAAPAAGGTSVPATAPMTTSTNAGFRANSNATQRIAVKPPAPASVPVRSLPDKAGDQYASTAPQSKSASETGASQNVRRSADGAAVDQVAMSRQAELGPRAKAVARQFSANASVLVEQHADGSVTVTVRPDKPLTSEEKDKLRRLLRSELNLGDNDLISIRQ